MSAQPEPQFLLLWKGRQSGPFSPAAIREKLEAGEISRMHQVQFNGKWIVLDEFMQKHGGGDPEEKRRAELEKREAQRRREFAKYPGFERGNGLAEDERHSLHSHLLPRTIVPQLDLPALPLTEPGHLLPEEPPQRTSRLAIAALAAGLCNFVPYLNFIAWIFALVLGHTALLQMKRDPEIGGQWMAIAALLITYFLAVMGLTFVLLMFGKSQHLY